MAVVVYSETRIRLFMKTAPSKTKSTGLGLLALGLAGAATLSTPVKAFQLQQGFAGVYAPANWTFTANGGDGSVDTSAAPASITLTGNDNDSEGLVTVYTINAAASGPVAFNWAYNTDDDDGMDTFGYLLN